MAIKWTNIIALSFIILSIVTLTTGFNPVYNDVNVVNSGGKMRRLTHQVYRRTKVRVVPSSAVTPTAMYASEEGEVRSCCLGDHKKPPTSYAQLTPPMGTRSLALLPRRTRDQRNPRALM